MTQDNEILAGKPLTDAQTAKGIVLVLLVVSFMGTWAMFAGVMTRTVELDAYLERTAELQEQVAALEREIAILRMPYRTGPLEPGGALLAAYALP
jgi:hypothetical protein